MHRLAGPGGFQHPAGSHQAVRLFQGIQGLQGHALPASRADAHNAHPGLPGKAEPGTEFFPNLRHGQPRHLGGTSDDHQLRPRLPGGGNFFVKPSGGAGVLGHQEFPLHAAQHGYIQRPAEGPLHGNDMGRGKFCLPAQPQRVLHGQHPGVHPLGKLPDAPEGCQFLAAGGEQDVPFPGVQVVHRPGKIRHKGTVLRCLCPGAQQPQIFRLRVGAGSADVLGYHTGVGMGGVHHQGKLLPGKQRRHLLPVQPTGVDGQIFRRFQQSLTVFRGHTGGNLHRLSTKKFHQFPAFRGARKHAQLIHAGILWELPFCRRYFGSWRCR